MQSFREFQFKFQNLNLLKIQIQVVRSPKNSFQPKWNHWSPISNRFQFQQHIKTDLIQWPLQHVSNNLGSISLFLTLYGIFGPQLSIQWEGICLKLTYLGFLHSIDFQRNNSIRILALRYLIRNICVKNVRIRNQWRISQSGKLDFKRPRFENLFQYSNSQVYVNWNRCWVDNYYRTMDKNVLACQFSC